MARFLGSGLSAWVQRQSPWPWLACLVALQHILVIHFTQDSVQLTVLALMIWGGALLTIEDLLPGFTPRPARWGLFLGTVLLVLVLIRINRIIYHDVAIHLAAPLLGVALVLLAAQPPAWRPYLPGLLILSMLPLQHVVKLSMPELQISLAGAQTAGIWLQSLGLDALVDRRLVMLPGGTISVEDQCNGLDMIIQASVAAVIFLLAFPLRRPWKWLLMVLAAPGFGFLVNTIRISVLALLDSAKEVPLAETLFKSFHQGSGSLVFSAVAVSLVGWLHLRLVEQELAHG